MIKIFKTKILFILAFFLFSPFFAKAGIWEQSTQSDFESGTVYGNLSIAEDSIKLAPGIIFENAEDENVDDWVIFDNDPYGAITNTFDTNLNSRVINLSSSDSINSQNTGFQYNASTGTIGSLRNIQWKMNTTVNGSIYIILATDFGTRIINYGPLITTEQDGTYIKYNLGTENADGNWHTHTRNLENDLKAFEPENNITGINYLAARGNLLLDDISFLPQYSTYTSSILDLGKNKIANFNRIMWEQNAPEDATITFQTRTSDNKTTWSEWSREYSNPSGEIITSTPRRYLQYKTILNIGSDISASLSLNKVTIEYNRTPGPTDNLLPANERSLTGSDKLTWDMSLDPDPEDIITYTLELDNDSDFNSPNSITSRIDYTEININQLENFSNLEDDTKYYWRVKTVDNQNNQSDYSSGENYFILNKGNTPPNAPNMGFNPDDSKLVKTLKPTIYWSASQDPDKADTTDTLSYILQIDKNNSFNSSHIYRIENNRTNYTIPDDLEDNTLYHYRIKTIDDENAESNWSDIQSFVVATGKSPILSISKTVGINTQDNSESSLLFGFINKYINYSILKAIYWPLLIIIIILSFFYLNKNIIFGSVLSPSYNKDNNKNKNSILASVVRSMDGVNKNKKIAPRTKKSHTKIFIVSIVFISIIIITLAGIYYYEKNPSPYKDNGKNIQIGDELTYRIDFKNNGGSTASDFIILDSIPSGTSYLENSAGINGTSITNLSNNNSVTFNNDDLKFELGNIDPNSSGYVHFKVRVDTVPKNRKIENTATIQYSESDCIQSTNKTVNYLNNDTSTITADINGLVWMDLNNNKAQDNGESGTSNIYLNLYQDSNNNNSLDEEDILIKDNIITSSSGNYQFNNIDSNNYFVKINEESLPQNSTITTENNPLFISINENIEYNNINFGINISNNEIAVGDNNTPLNKIEGLVWVDNNSNSEKDIMELGIENVTLKLYEDSNINNTLEFDQDSFVSKYNTNSRGQYQISGLLPKTYLILVEEESLLSESFNLTTPNNPVVVKLETEGQEYSDVNFGYHIEDRKLNISPSENNQIELISSPEDINKQNTITFTPIEVTRKTHDNNIAPPALTHLGSAEIKDYNNNYSLPINNKLTLKGESSPHALVTLFIYNNLDLKINTSANENGLWEIIIDTKLFKTGEHRIYTQSKDNNGNKSIKTEIAIFNINKSNKPIYQINYKLALIGLVMVVITIISTTLVKGKGKSKNKTKRKTKVKSKPKSIKKKKTTTNKIINTTKSKTKKTTKRKIKVK